MYEKNGYAVCPCGKYAHILSASVKLRTGYDGELCSECLCWMVAVSEIVQDKNNKFLSCTNQITPV